MPAHELIPGLAAEAGEPLLYRLRETAASADAEGSTDSTPGREYTLLDVEDPSSTFTDDKRSKEYAAED